jgi:hypothetical protein
MRYSVVEDDVTVPNARGLREVPRDWELTVEAPVARRIRLRSGSATTLNAQGVEHVPLNRRNSIPLREQRSTQRRPRLTYQSYAAGRQPS